MMQYLHYLQYYDIIYNSVLTMYMYVHTTKAGIENQKIMIIRHQLFVVFFLSHRNTRLTKPNGLLYLLNKSCLCNKESAEL